MGIDPFCERLNEPPSDQRAHTLLSQMSTSFACEDARMYSFWRFHLTCVAASGLKSGDVRVNGKFCVPLNAHNPINGFKENFALDNN